MALRLGVLAPAITAMAIAGCGGTYDDGDAAAPTTSRASASSAVAPAPASAAGTEPPEEPEEQLVGFTSPTGAISCMLDSGYVRCDVQEHTWDLPPRPADCEFDYGQGLSMAAGELPEVVCAGDTTAGAGAPLAYGESIAVGSIRCDSAENGVTCQDTASGHGFVVAREAFRTF